MGTSKSYGGPTDVSKLLPAWALPPPDPAGDQQDPEPGTDAEPVATTELAADGNAAESADQGTEDADVTSTAPQLSVPLADVRLIPRHQRWKGAKRSLGTALRGAGGARDYRGAARDYVQARGGSRKAARTATGGSRAVAGIGGFLGAVARSSVSQAAAELGLGSLTGRSADDVLAMLTDVLAPDGATLEEAAARRATAEILAKLYDERGVEEHGLESLDAMTADDVRSAIVASVSSYIFYRWVQELGLAIERKATSAKEAVAIEREMRTYIRETVKLDLSGADVLKVDWRGAEGSRLVESVFQQAYSLIETAQ